MNPEELFDRLKAGSNQGDLCSPLSLAADVEAAIGVLKSRGLHQIKLVAPLAGSIRNLLAVIDPYRAQVAVIDCSAPSLFPPQPKRQAAATVERGADLLGRLARPDARNLTLEELSELANEDAIQAASRLLKIPQAADGAVQIGDASCSVPLRNAVQRIFVSEQSVWIEDAIVLGRATDKWWKIQQRKRSAWLDREFQVSVESNRHLSVLALAWAFGRSMALRVRPARVLGSAADAAVLAEVKVDLSDVVTELQGELNV
jgi:hypothetical protein